MECWSLVRYGNMYEYAAISVSRQQESETSKKKIEKIINTVLAGVFPLQQIWSQSAKHLQIENGCQWKKETWGKTCGEIGHAVSPALRLPACSLSIFSHSSLVPFV